MIRKIGRCGVGYPNATYEELFEFEDGTSEKEMENELWEWAEQFLEAWFVDEEDNEA